MVQRIINITELPDGTLEISLDNTDDAREELKEMMDKWPNEDVWVELLEPTSTSGSYALVAPELVGALTESPIIATEQALPNEDTDVMELHPEAKYWWFPNYMVENELETLLTTGKVVFSNN